MTDAGHCDHCHPECDGTNWHMSDAQIGGLIWASGHCPLCVAVAAERARIWEEAFRRADSTNDRGAQWALDTFARWVRGDKHD